MKRISERRVVVILFILVFVTFSFAHEESKKLEQIYAGFSLTRAPELTAASQYTKPVESKSTAPNKILMQETMPQ